MFNKTVLDNGVRVITSCARDKQSFSLGIWLNVGSRFESPQIWGISHFLEHLVFKGTKKYTCQQIKESIEGVGGSFNGFTSEEATCYLVKIPAPYLDMAVDILSDMVINPTVPAKEVEKERTVILEEIKMYKDLPQSYVHELLDQLLWPDQPLGMSVLGTNETVSKINRDKLLAYKNDHYTPENIVISAAGRMNHKQLVKKIKFKFGGLKKKKLNTAGPAVQSQKRPGITLSDKNTEQTHLALGFHGLKRDHPLKYSLGLLNIILGANSSSRLFNEIREKRGLAYEIGTNLKRLKDTGAFIVHAGVDNNKVTDTIALILAQLQKTKDSLVEKDEFNRAKEFYIGQLMLSLEDTMDQMLWIGESTLSLNRTFSVKDVIKEIRRVKRDDLRFVSRLIFKQENINLSAIGPVKNKEKQIQSLLKLR
jgi:predicted Zn-dependent peptidase